MTEKNPVVRKLMIKKGKNILYLEIPNLKISKVIVSGNDHSAESFKMTSLEMRSEKPFE